MRIGLGFYRRMLTRENFQFARQAGCTDVVAHLVDYFGDGKITGSDGKSCWGTSNRKGELWSEEELSKITGAAADAGVSIAAVENFDPAHWHDVLLDGPQKAAQLEDLKTMIRRVGAAGIPVIGYNFSVAGVWGHVERAAARGGARTVSFLGDQGPAETPIPNGQVWNMTYNPDAPPGDVGVVTKEQLWRRVEEFLNEVIPVAEAAGVRLAAHPDDPPVEQLRGTARLINRPELNDRLLQLMPSRANALEFCLGTLQEMPDCDVYGELDKYSRAGAIAYVHCRNVRGKAPNYDEVFVDEGDLDVRRALTILHRNGYDGVIIPDHTPLMTCDAPWHSGMAYAVGYLRATVDAIVRETPNSDASAPTGNVPPRL